MIKSPDKKARLSANEIPKAKLRMQVYGESIQQKIQKNSYN